MELASLLFSQDNWPDERKHSIQVLATFEIVNRENNDATWYFLFDWARGNLDDYWKRNDKLVRDYSRLPWMAEQFHGLCKALQGVHNERDKTVPSFNLETSGASGKLYGRHGDINPSNFLWFTSANHNSIPDILILADFGLGRLHRQVSRSEQDPRSIARTATYRAPEFDLNKPLISRKTDIFSLGCVFLEYITWFFLGSQGIEEKASLRFELDIYGFHADTFFTFHREQAATQGKERQFFIKDSVRNLVHELQSREDCCIYLHQLLDFILNQMLLPDPHKRIDASRLTKEMDKLQRACNSERDFYTPSSQIMDGTVQPQIGEEDQHV